jgi:hypothetical protein
LSSTKALTLEICFISRDTSNWLSDRGYVQEHHHVQLTQRMIDVKDYTPDKEKPSVYSDFSRVGKLRRYNILPITSLSYFVDA